MDINSFKAYLEIAKELGVIRFKIDGEYLDAQFVADEPAPIKQIDFNDVLSDMPSDRELLNLTDLPDDRSPKE